MRLVTWNVQWCRGMDGVVDPARVARELRALGSPEVCCLQEIAQGFDTLPGSAGEDQVAELAAELPGYSAHFTWGVDVAAGSARRRFGNLVLSRLPVGRVLRHSLPWPAQDDVPSMPRVAVEAVVRSPWGWMRVMTTHLEYYSAQQRRAQVEHLVALNAEAAAHALARPAAREDQGPFHPQLRPASGVLTGDFNMGPEDPLIGRLEEVLLDAWKVVHSGRPHAPTFRLQSPESPPYCCDFVFLTSDLAPRLRKVEVDLQTRASDHQPVVVEFG